MFLMAWGVGGACRACAREAGAGQQSPPGPCEGRLRGEYRVRRKRPWGGTVMD